MIKIGIVAKNNSDEMANFLSAVLKNQSNLIAIKKNSKKTEKEARFYQINGIDYMLIIFDSKMIYPVEVDILILDNEENNRVLSYDLIKCIGEHTILIYNTDNGYLPYINHPNAIDYGFASESSVSISSIDYRENEVMVILSIQKPFKTLYSQKIDICEFLVKVKTIEKISNLLPGVICALVCGIYSFSKVKI